MSKIVNISEEKFRKVLREIVSGEYADSPQDPFASQKEDDNHDEGLVGKMDYETFDKQLPGAADFPIK